MLRVDTVLKRKAPVANRVTKTCTACDNDATHKVEASFLKEPMRLCDRHTNDWRGTRGVTITKL